jgi:hypothetical protein
MRTLTLQDIEALAHGESVPRFTGKIKKVWDQKSGEGEYGQWFLQNIIVAVDDGSDGEITVTWTGEDEFERSWIGKQVAFECGSNKEGKLVGIVRDIRTAKDGKVYKGIKMTAAGKVRLLAESGMLPDHESGTTAPQPAKAAPQRPPAASNDEKLEAYAKHSKRVFLLAWGEAEDALEWLLGKESRSKLSEAERLDLHLRIAQGFAIEMNKIIRKERF